MLEAHAAVRQTVKPNGYSKLAFEEAWTIVYIYTVSSASYPALIFCADEGAAGIKGGLNGTAPSVQRGVVTWESDKGNTIDSI